MICRGGIVVGGWGDMARPGVVPYREGVSLPQASRPRWVVMLLAIPLVAWALIFVGPARNLGPPLIESDYCYQLIAADRLYSGHGLTSLQPAAPRQPWTWQYDFGFLTQWPAGYSLLVWLVRYLTGMGTVAACHWIGIVAASVALVAWYGWLRLMLPRGVAGYSLAVAGAMSAVSFSALANPSTDAILIAFVPVVLQLVWRREPSDGQGHCVPAGQPLNPNSGGSAREGTDWLRFVLGGLLSGLLVWFRYAAIFLPFSVAIGLWLVGRMAAKGNIESEGPPGLKSAARLACSSAEDRGASGVGRLGGWRIVVLYLLGAGLPVVMLVMVNRWFAASGTLQTQVNLGSQITFQFSWEMLATAWWRLTDLGILRAAPRVDAWVHGLFALGSIGWVLGSLVVPKIRRAVLIAIRQPVWVLAASTVCGLAVFLLGVTAVFGNKFNFVNLDRYYRPVRPLCLVLLVSPLFWLLGTKVKRIVVVPLLVAVIWGLGNGWYKDASRLAATTDETTSYGRRAHCFTPGAEPLFAWIRTLDAQRMVIVSNFQDYITLETGYPAFPIPVDAGALREWTTKVALSRATDQIRVFFILDPNNRWRSSWLPSTADVIRRFDLGDALTTVKGVSALVYEFDDPLSRVAAGE